MTQGLHCWEARGSAPKQRYRSSQVEEFMAEESRPPVFSSGLAHHAADPFRLLVESTRDYAIFMVDPAGVVMSWNPGVERIFGYEQSEFLGSPFSRLYTPEDVAADRPTRDLSIARRDRRMETEAERLRKDGQRFWAISTITDLTDAFGRHVGFAVVTRDISERRRMEESLRETVSQLSSGDEKYRVTLRSIGDAVITTDETGRVTFLNPVAEELTGWRLDQARGRMLHEIFPIVNEESRQPVESPVSKVLREGVVVGLANHTLLLRRDGKETPIADSGAPICDDTGRIMGVVLVFRDQTTERQREKQTAAELSLLEDLLRGTPLTQWLDNLCRSYEKLSPGSVCSVLLLDGDRLRHGAAPSLPREYVQAIDGSLIGPTGGSCGTAAYRKELIIVSDIETDPLWADYRHLARPHQLRACWSLPFFDRAGRVLGTFAIYYSHPRSPTEEELKQIQTWPYLASLAVERHRDLSSLVESRNFFDSLVQSLDGVVWQADPATFQFTYVSQQAEKIFGYPLSEWYKPGFWIEHLHPEDRNWAAEFCRKSTEQGKDHRFEYRFRTADGTYLWINDRVTVRLDPHGKPVFATGLLVDVTPQKRLEEQMRQASKLEAIGLLAGGVAHDFNNLLTVISGYAELLLGAAREGDPQREYVSEILRAAKRASELTNQLLAFGRRQVLAPKIISLNHVVQNCEKMLHRLIGEDIQLVTAYDHALSPIKADPAQIEQILLNLVVNSRDAMPHGGTLTIETANRNLDETEIQSLPNATPGRYVALKVTDTGVGMPPEVLARIFEPFFTTKEIGKGTGLGLSTVYGIVKQSEGHVVVQSEVGRGTTFTILFPAVVADVEQPEADQGATAVRGGSETILLVEDEEGLRKLARLILELHGYKVLEARNGIEAIDVEKKHGGPIDLLVTDVVMPEMSGSQLVQVLQPRQPRMKVLYTSGYPNDAIVRHGLSLARDPFLPKPFSAVSLPQKIREILDRSW
jgi:PAS domain S-box-containing protein